MKRDLLARLLAVTGVLDSVLCTRRRLRLPVLPVLTYHRVGRAPELAGELDTETVDAEPEAFCEQLDLVARHLDVVSISDLLAWVRGRPLPNAPVLLCFDDGYR